MSRIAAFIACFTTPFVAWAASPAAILVAAHNSSESDRSAAHFVCDGEADQQQINDAIAALPKVGGIVRLAAGDYDIRRVPGELGGVLITRSNVILAGAGHATTLRQAAGQETNVIRIIGEGVGHITIRDLHIDANRDENPLGEGDPDVSHARFEFCGIKAFRTYPGGPSGEDTQDITIQNCHVHDARRLGIMLEGPNMRVIDNIIGNANSDAVEILTGPGIIRGNYFEITGRTHVACGSDRANDVLMTQNIVHVKSNGDLDIGFRSWAGSQRHVITDNVLRVDAEGKCGKAMDVRGDGTVVSGNAIYSANSETPLPLWLTGGGTVLSGNLLENVTIVVNDKTDKNLPIVVYNNIMSNSTLEHQAGNLRLSPLPAPQAE